MTEKTNIEKFVEDWINGHEPDTFVKDEYGRYMYKSGSSNINIEVFFQEICKDFLEHLIDDLNKKLAK